MSQLFDIAYDDYIKALRNREVMESGEKITVNERGKLL